MTNKQKVIDVSVCVFPDGTTYWMKDANQESIEKALDRFKDKNKQFRHTDCTAGVVMISMPEESYNKIPATNI